ncbi:MAG: bifunctional hydroxymethylpyrimidine kinase/phosphomethylpyrimidine kinase [Candidatus Glassbacteria bacterium]|nr:bifunctional hydroxymethylpyrimidine kinase/phosphomethylpyrimidine kinase [Candidatus Glassbacteria bacterium]
MKGNECPPRALTVAGSDSGGGAGIQADLKTFQSFGCFGMSVLTAATAQNSLGVQGVCKLPADFVRLQLEAVLGDIGADAIKCGMLADRKIVEAVAEVLASFKGPPLVLDTVLVAKSGDPLLEEPAVEAMVGRLFPRAALITPNAREAERLVGFPVTGIESMARAAEKLQGMGAGAVLVKGGHLEGDTLYDYLALPSGEEKIFEQARIRTSHTHGTGCTLSAAVAAGLALGLSLEQAVAAARNYVLRGIENSHPTGAGYGTLRHGPFEERLKRIRKE